MPNAKDSAFADYRDVAEVVATAFATDELVAATYELAAAREFTRADIEVSAEPANHPDEAIRRTGESP